MTYGQLKQSLNFGYLTNSQLHPYWRKLIPSQPGDLICNMACITIHRLSRARADDIAYRGRGSTLIVHTARNT